MKVRLDQYLAVRGLAPTRSQAESYIRIGAVTVNGKKVLKPGMLVGETDKVTVQAGEQYVSRAGLKLASVAGLLGLDFKGKTVLDVGSSTGGFTDYALKAGAAKVIAVDVGTDQLHHSLHGHDRIELYEQTDIRDFQAAEPIDLVVVDVSFISLREILPHIARTTGRHTVVAAMLKPQFEAGADAKHKGIIKNERLRRDILKDFEAWVKQYFAILGKADSQVTGSKGNRERFYKLGKALQA
jgi:23S rRNA (cytidine1920-2'-O)/16S rRNA (cytidine1409-2'-O)-methyltransferase